MTSAMSSWGNTPEEREEYARQLEAIDQAHHGKSVEQIAAELEAERKAKKGPVPDLTSMTPDALYDYVQSIRNSQDEDGELWRENVYNGFFNLLTRKTAEEMVERQLNPIGPLKLVTQSEVLARPDPEWWVERLFQKGTIAELAGPGGIGKSFLMLHLANCIATGTQAFVNWHTKKGKVLYVAAEGASAFGKRNRAWADYHRVTPDEDSIVYVEDGVSLSDDASITQLADLVRVGEFDFIVIDTYSQLSGVNDENAAAANAHALRNVKRIRDAREGSTVVIVHHTDARGTKARGSTTLKDNVDTLILMKATTGDTFSLTTKGEDSAKQKDGPGVLLQGFKLQPHLTAAVVVWTGSTPTDPQWPLLTEVLKDGAWHPVRDLYDALGVIGSSGSEYDKAKRYIAKLPGLEKDDSNPVRPKYRLLDVVKPVN